MLHLMTSDQGFRTKSLSKCICAEQIDLESSPYHPLYVMNGSPPGPVYLSQYMVDGPCHIICNIVKHALQKIPGFQNGNLPCL